LSPRALASRNFEDSHTQDVTPKMSEETALMRAMMDGDEAQVLDILDDESCRDMINVQRDIDGRTALMVGLTLTHHEDLCLELIQHDFVDLDKVDKDGNTALMIAMKSSQKSLFCELVDYGADLTIVNKKGESVLTNTFPSDGENALSCAIRLGKESTVKSVLKAGMPILTIDEAIATALLEQNAFLYLLCLIQNGANVNYMHEGDPLLCVVLQRLILYKDHEDFYATVTKFIYEMFQNGVVDRNLTDKDGKTALHYAAILGDKDIKELCLSGRISRRLRRKFVKS